MPIFGKVHKCRTCERWSEKKNVNNEWNKVNHIEEKERPPKEHVIAQTKRKTKGPKTSKNK